MKHVQPAWLKHMAVVQNLPLNVPEIQGRLWISRHVQIEHVRSGFPAEISKESQTRLNAYAELCRQTPTYDAVWTLDA